VPLPFLLEIISRTAAISIESRIPHLDT